MNVNDFSFWKKKVIQYFALCLCQNRNAYYFMHTIRRDFKEILFKILESVIIINQVLLKKYFDILNTYFQYVFPF